MSFLATLFSQSRFERKPRITASRREVMKRLGQVVSRDASRSLRQRAKAISSSESLSACEHLEPRIALSVTTVDTQRLDENFSGKTVTHSGQVLIASESGSDIFIQQLQTEPNELLIADNGSFLDYLALEDINVRYDEIFVTNGALQSKEANEEIIPSQWWLFPSPDDPTKQTSTRLAIDSPNIDVGPAVGTTSSTADFFGTIKYKQGDGTISTWTYSAWDGAGSGESDFVQPPGNEGFSQLLAITSGPGYGGSAESFANPEITAIQGLTAGYVFPQNIRFESVGSSVGQRRYYLVCDWSQAPVSPPVMEANYVGYGGFSTFITGGFFPGSGFLNTINYSFFGRTDYRVGDAPTVGIAMETSNLRAPVALALAGTASDGSQSLGIVPGTLTGKLVVGPRDGEDQYSVEFKDRQNASNATSYENSNYTLFFEDLDGSSLRQFGEIQTELSPGVFRNLDYRHQGYRTQNDRAGNNETTRTLVQGAVTNQSVIEFRIGHYNNLLGDEGYNNTNARQLDGVNVDITEFNLQNDSAADSVRVTDLEYIVFVKPTTPNAVVFSPGATVTRNVTVDLLSEGSSIFVNSPINVADAGGDIDFRATNIHINAPTTSQDYVFIGRSESEQSARLPRATNPQGGTQTSPTFGVFIPSEAQEITVQAIPVLNDGSIEELVVLPGNEGFGYDVANLPEVSITSPSVLNADVDITSISGGVSSLLLGTGGQNYEPSGELPVTFSEPQLRRVEEIIQFSSSDLAQGYSAAPVIAISQPEIVGSNARVGYGERARSQAAKGNGLLLSLTSGGSNYGGPPNVKIQRTQQAKDAGIPLYDQTIPSIFADALSIPTITPVMKIRASVVPIEDDPNRIDYQSGTVSSIKVTDPGFGLNLQGLDPDSVTFIDDINDRFEVVVSGGAPNEVNRIGLTITNTNPATGGPDDYTIGKTVKFGTQGNSTGLDWPEADDVNHATIEITESWLGALRWQNSGTGSLSFTHAGQNYEGSPSVQFVTKLSAAVPPEISGDNFGSPAVREIDAVNDASATATHKVSLDEVIAYRDDLSPEETNRFSTDKFRDIDYLSYVNDPLFEDNVLARVSTDGVAFYNVLIEPFTGLNQSLKNLDELTGQLGISADPDETYLDDQGNEVDFSIFVEGITETHIYFDESFVDLQLVDAADVYATMGRDPARGRAVASNGEILAVEVTYAGSGYTEVPTVFIGEDRNGNGELDNNEDLNDNGQLDGTGATATAIVSGGLYELTINNAGLNYVSTEVPARITDLLTVPPADLLVDIESYVHGNGLDVFGALDFGQQNPIANFGVINSAIQGGSIVYPGSGLSIGGGGFTGFQSKAIVIPGNRGIADIEEEAEFAAIVDSSGILRGFEAVRTGKIKSVEITGVGSGYQTAPQVTFDPPPAGGVQAVGVAQIVLDSIAAITIINPGSGYLTTPNITIEQSPGGETATANAIPERKNGKGYSPGITVTVEPPPPATDATARAVINASRGVVNAIEVVDSGMRYRVPPRVTIRPPNPRGEGIAATAEAVLDVSGRVDRIIVTDGGGGYSAPPVVLVEPRFDFSRSEFVDIASEINAEKYEIYLSHSDWTERERGQFLLRPQAVLGNDSAPNGLSETIYFEASSTDLILEGDFKANQIMALMQSGRDREMLAPFTVTTRSRATGEQSGTILADTLAITLGNNIPTPQVGSSLMNIFDVRTEVDNLRITAAESISDPRGAFPYALSVTENDNLIVDAVPRSGGPISFDVNNKLSIVSAVQTDGDVSIKARVFDQTSPVITTTGQIAVEATEVAVRNSLQVLAAPLDSERVDIRLTATSGGVDLEGLIEAPNAIEIRQSDTSGRTGVGGASRLSAGRLRIQADGSIDVSTDVESAVATSEQGGISISEIDDIRFNNLAASNGTISLEAMGVDLGAEADNPIALTARILAANALVASAPNGSMDVQVDSSDNVDLGLEDTLVNGKTPADGTAVLAVAGVNAAPNGKIASVKITDKGSSYVPNSNNITVAFSAPPVGVGDAVNVTAEGFGITNGLGQLVQVNITENGSGYQTPPNVTFANPTYESVMQAGGNVRITSTAGSVDLFDGPVAAASARQVRAATTGKLAVRSTYQGNTPGAFPSTLSGEGALPAFDGISVEVGDRVLLKDQADEGVTDRFNEQRENGIYVITRLGGGVNGYQDWLLTRYNSADTREDFLPGTFVRILDGLTQAGSVFQTTYANVPELSVTRTDNNQLVVSGSIGGLLNLNTNDSVSGPGIIRGARVTGIDFEHGVISIGIGNQVEVKNVIGPSNGLYSLTIDGATHQTEYLFEAIEAADNRGETILVTGSGLAVGASVQGYSRDANNNDLTIALTSSSVTDVNAISNVALGFVSAASGRTALNPAVRSFLISSGVTTSGDTMTLPPTFTNYGSLRVGQLVFGDGIAANTVITKVFPGSKTVEVSPNGLPRALDFSELVTASSSASPYYTESFENYLQMPDSFNEFAILSIGQRVEGAGIQPGAVITAIDPVYRQIGLSSGSVSSDSSFTSVSFKPVEQVNFGMIDQLGTGSASFGVETFGYGAMTFKNPRVASGLASIISGAPYGNGLTVNDLHGETEIQLGLLVTGVGLNDGYRVESYNGRDIFLYSATAKAVTVDSTSGQLPYQATITVDDGFDSFNDLKAGMAVGGPAINSGSTSAVVTISQFDEVNRTVTLTSNVELDRADLEAKYFVFGQPFKQKFRVNESAKSAISVHAERASVSTFIGSENPRQNTRYQVTSESGGAKPGSLASLLEIAQQNQFQRNSIIVGDNPVITFHQDVDNIVLDRPLASVVEKPLTINGLIDIDGSSRNPVAIDGRFISQTATGGVITPADEVNGLVVSGPNASGSVIRGVRVGGFNNGAAILVDNASEVLIDNVNIGLNADDGRAGNKFGVYVTGGSSGTTFSNSEIVGSESSAVRLERGSTDTVIVGNKIGNSAIINNVGIEIAGSETKVGVGQIYPKVVANTFSNAPNFYEATLRANSKVIDVGASDAEWKHFSPGLAVIGTGLPRGTVIVSVDKPSEQLIVSQVANQNILSDGQIFIGHGATALNASNEMVLNDSVPLENVFLGQLVRVASSKIPGSVVKNAKIIEIDQTARVIRLDSTFDNSGFDAIGTRIIEFVGPAENVIESNNQGIVIGVFGNGSGFQSSTTLVMATDFKGWRGLSTGTGVYGLGIPDGATIASFNEEIRQIDLSAPLETNLSRSAIRFEGSDELRMVNTTVSNNVNDGVVIGGGANHRFGHVKELPVYVSRQEAEANKQVDEQVLELVSWQMTSDVSVGGEVNISVGQVSSALLDIVTISETVTNTLATFDKIDVPADVGALLSAGLAIVGNGIEANTIIENVAEKDSATHEVTLSKPMIQTLRDVNVRFLNESHPDLNNVRVYGSGIDRSVYIERFDADLDRMVLSQSGTERTNAVLYFGLDQYVSIDPSKADSVAAGMFVEGELLIETDATGGLDGVDLTLGSGFSEWSQLSYGLQVTGPSITADTVVVDWDESTKTLTLSQPLESAFDDKVQIQNAGVPEYTKVDSIRAEYRNEASQAVTGFIALSSSVAAEANPLLLGEVDLNEIRMVRRDATSNSIAANGGLGMTTAFVGSTQQIEQTYGDILATWTVAGTFFDIALDRANDTLLYSTNLRGPLDPLIFAKLPINIENDELFSRFSKTDRYSNQYEIATTVVAIDDGEDLPENPNPPTEPPVEPPPDLGDPPDPEDEIWPGTSF
jgi:hypothetical protein